MYLAENRQTGEKVRDGPQHADASMLLADGKANLGFLDDRWPSNSWTEAGISD